MPSTSSRSSPASSRAALSAFAPSLSWLAGRKRPYSLWPMPAIAAWSRIENVMRSSVRPQQNAAGRAAGFDELVRLARFLERERARNDRLHLAALHQGEHVLELVARGAGHRKHRLVLKEKLRRVERNELAGELSDQDPAPGDAQAAPHRLEQRRADVVDEDIDAAPAGEALHLGREVLAARAHHDVMGAHLANQLDLVRRGGLRDDQRSGEARELHRVQPEPTARAGDQRAFAHLQPADVAHAVEAGADRAGRDRRVGERHAVWHGGDVVVADGDVLAIAADHAVVAEELALEAERLAAAAAEAAGAADVVALRGRDALAHLEARHLAAQLDHRARDLVAEHARHFHPRLQGAVARQQVVKADAAGVDLDDDLARAGDRVRDALQPHRVDAAGLPHHHRFHRGTNFTRVAVGVTASKWARTRRPERIRSRGTPTRLLNTRTPSSSRTWTTS